MTYFTILHWIAVGIIVALFALTSLLIIRSDSERNPLPTILTAALFFGLIAILAIYGLDKYTKVARLENVTQKKILINESFSISGQIRNIGNFTIGKCTLEVKISNGSLEVSSDGPLFVPKSVLDNFFKRDNSNINTIDTTKTFVIAENLKEAEMHNFTVFMRYPPSFSKPYTRYELSCH